MGTGSEREGRPRLPVERVVAEDPDFPPPGALRGTTDMSHIELTMLGHAHIDLGYRWDLAETVERIAPDTFRGVLDLMERTPGFVFCQSQMFLYHAMELREPELFGRIRDQVRRGSWEVIGEAWCEYDAALPSGESVVRQHLQGARYAAEALGVSPGTVAFVPDSFIAHAATLPQILAGCGFRAYLFGRGLPSGLKRAFRWKGPDGSFLVAYLPFGPYSNPPLTTEYLEGLKPYVDAAAGVPATGAHELALYGIGDHGGGPRDADIEALEALRSRAGSPRWRYGTAREFFAAAFPDPAVAGLQEHTGSLRSFATGALTSQAPAKRENRLCERLLLETEAIVSLATMLGRKPAHPRVDFVHLWRDLLTQQFHDILPGTSVASVYRQAMEAYRSIRARASLLREDALARIGSRMDTSGEGYPLELVNPGLRAASGVMSIAYPPWIPPGTPLELRDDRGEIVASECLLDSLAFLASVEPLSYRLYRAHPRPLESAPSRNLRTYESATESVVCGRTTVLFDPATGDVLRAEMDGVAVAAPAFALELWEEEEKSTSWVQAFTGRLLELSLVEAPRVVVNDLFRTVVRTVSRSRWSTFTREITLYRSLPKVELELSLDWRESDAFLKLRVSPESLWSGRVVRSSLAHGFETIGEPEREFCMQDWVDVNDGERGLAVFTDGSYGADVTERGIGISVIRSARDMDPAMAHGAHTLKLSVCAYAGAFLQSRLLASACAPGASLQARWETSHHGGLMSWGKIDTGSPIPSRGSFVAVDRKNVEICAVKLPEEHYTPDALVLRLRELDGESTECGVTLPLPASSVWAADHLERPLERLEGREGSRVSLSLGPYAIRTFLVNL